MIELLIEHGADVNADDEDGDTPLHLAVIHQAVGNTGIRGVRVNFGCLRAVFGYLKNTSACLLQIFGIFR